MIPLHCFVKLNIPIFLVNHFNSNLDIKEGDLATPLNTRLISAFADCRRNSVH